MSKEASIPNASNLGMEARDSVNPLVILPRVPVPSSSSVKFILNGTSVVSTEVSFSSDSTKFILNGTSVVSTEVSFSSDSTKFILNGTISLAINYPVLDKPKKLGGILPPLL